MNILNRQNGCISTAISTCLPTSSASSPLCYSSIPLSWFFALFFLHPNASLHYRSSCGYPTNATKTKYNLSAKFSNEDWEASSPRRHHPLFILILSVPCPSQRRRRRNSCPPPTPFSRLLSFSWDACVSRRTICVHSVFFLPLVLGPSFPSFA